MARKSSALGRLAVAALAAIALWQLAGLVFVAPGQVPLRVQGTAGAAALAGAIAAAPQPASAAELTFDGWGPTEIVAVVIPFLFIFALYLEWESKQDPVDDITGPGTLGQTNDGGAYFRRSPENG
mmetsp:Transcript_106825/g.217903  ORF Transcript_106825/g.217903 Transcript_106825/m.217903 type:complete len:125 (+) Transcript_106825:36-410(+)